MLTSNQKRTLLAVARDAIASRFEQAKLLLPQDPEFEHKRGVFVSLHADNELRGCIGYVKGYKSILSSVVEMAIAAAFNDPRFAPLEKRELESINIEISVLGELELLPPGEEPEIGKDGLYIVHPYGSGLLLPQVAVECCWDPHTFLRQVCRKAGLNQNAYKDPDCHVYHFHADVFCESDTF
jgi:AmmeMemoRadiSam system protein A